MEKSDLKIFNYFNEPIYVLDADMKLIYNNENAKLFLKNIFNTEIYIGENIEKFAFDFFKDVKSLYEEISVTKKFIKKEIYSSFADINLKIQIDLIWLFDESYYLTVINTDLNILHRDKYKSGEKILSKYQYEKGKEGIIIFDEKEQILFFNKKFLDIWNLKSFESYFKTAAFKLNDVLSLMSDLILDWEDFMEFINSKNIKSENISRGKEITLKNNIKYNFHIESVYKSNKSKMPFLFIFEEQFSDSGYLSPTFKNKAYSTFQDVTYGVIIFDNKYNLFFVNNFLCKILKYDIDEIMLLNAKELFQNQIYNDDIIPMSEVNGGMTISKKLSIKGKDGVFVDFDLTFKPYVDNLIITIFNPVVKETIHSEDKKIQSDIFYRLAVKLRNFNHNEVSLTNLNRIGLLIKNLNNVTYHALEDSEIDGSKNLLFPEAMNRIMTLIKEYNFSTQPLLNEILLLLNLVEPELKSLNLLSKIRELSKSLENCANENSKVFSLIYNENDNILKSDLILRNQNIILENGNKIKYIIKNIRNLLYKNYLTDIEYILNEVSQKYKKQYESIPINISVAKPSKIFIDPNELKDIIDILFNNAYQAMSKSDTSGKEINIAVFSSNNIYKMNFENTGSKIDEKLKDKLFIIGSSTKSENRGFGLYYIKNCISKFGGDIYYDDKYKDGVRFILEFKQI